MPLLDGLPYDPVATVGGLPVRYARVAATTAGDATVIAVAAGYKVRLLGYVLTAKTAVDLELKTGATSRGPVYPAANGGAVAPVAGVAWFEGADGEDLVLNLSADAVVGHVVYVLVPLA